MHLPNLIYPKFVRSVYLRINDPDRCNFIIHCICIYFCVIIKTNNYNEKLWSTRTCMFHSQNLIGPNAVELLVPAIFNNRNEVPISVHVIFFFLSFFELQWTYGTKTMQINKIINKLFSLNSYIGQRNCGRLSPLCPDNNSCSMPFQF